MTRLQFAPRLLGRWLGIALSLTVIASVEAGVKIVPTYDATINARPNAQEIKQVINSAIAFYQSKLTDNITVNITFRNVTSGLGQSSWPVYLVPYSTLNTAMRRDATSTNDTTALSFLPSAFIDPVQGQRNVFIKQANLKALGIRAPAGSDGTISLNTSFLFTSPSNLLSYKYDLYAVVCHEINEVLGLGSFIGIDPAAVTFYRAAILPEDLFRYDAGGLRSFTTTSSVASYFSLNGTSKLARFNQDSGGDYGDWYSGVVVVTPQVQDAFATPGVVVNKSQTAELIALDVIGYNRSGTGAAANTSSGAQFVGTFNSQTGVPSAANLGLSVLGVAPR